MKLTMSRFAFRLSNRVPELIAVVFYAAGLAACVAIVKGSL